MKNLACWLCKNVAVVVAYFTVLTLHFSAGTGKAQDTLNQERQPRDENENKDLNKTQERDVSVTDMALVSTKMHISLKQWNTFSRGVE
jgi:hypothetical protein